VSLCASSIVRKLLTSFELLMIIFSGWGVGITTADWILVVIWIEMQIQEFLMEFSQFLYRGNSAIFDGNPRSF